MLTKITNAIRRAVPFVYAPNACVERCVIPDTVCVHIDAFGNVLTDAFNNPIECTTCVLVDGLGNVIVDAFGNAILCP